MQRALRQSAIRTHDAREVNRAPVTPSHKTHPVQGYGGNQAALRRLSRTLPHIQCKLEIGAVNDPLEAEADRAADQVMRMPVPAGPSSAASPILRRKCAGCEEEEKKLSRKASGNASAMDGAAAPPIVHEALHSPGRPLDAATRSSFESRFGGDFSAVRIHADEAAGRSAQTIGAAAYTAGHDIVFAPGRYQPQSAGGQRLLAHELAHTIQQGAAGVLVARTPVSPMLAISGTSDMIQRSAECPYSFGTCGGQPCTHSTGGNGFCRWSGTIANGCVCIKIESSTLVRWVETVLLAALLAIGVVIALDALVALVACILSGACEIAAAVAIVGVAGAILIMKLINSAPKDAVASLSSPDTGNAGGSSPDAAPATAPAPATTPSPDQQTA